jgi:hypothetical protein
VTDPTIAEVVRRLDDVTRSVERVAATLESSYVRREVYEAKHEALRSWARQEFNDVRGDITRIEEARKADQAFRRQIMAGASIGLILLLVNLVLATSNFIARAGG